MPGDNYSYREEETKETVLFRANGSEGEFSKLSRSSHDRLFGERQQSEQSREVSSIQVGSGNSNYQGTCRESVCFLELEEVSKRTSS